MRHFYVVIFIFIGLPFWVAVELINKLTDAHMHRQFDRFFGFSFMESTVPMQNKGTRKKEK